MAELIKVDNGRNKVMIESYASGGMLLVMGIMKQK